MGIRVLYIVAAVYAVVSSLGFLQRDLPPYFLPVLLIILTLYYLYYTQKRKIQFAHTILAGIVANLSVQLTGGVHSPLFLSYVIVLPIIGYKEHYSNYWIIAFCMLGAEILSSLFNRAFIIWPMGLFGAAIFVFGIIIKKRMENVDFLRKSLVKYESRDEFFSPANFEHKRIVTSVRDIDQHAGIERPLLFYVKLIDTMFNAYTTAIFSRYNDNLTLIQGFSHSELFRRDSVIDIKTGIYRQVISARKTILIEEYVQDPEELGYYKGEIKIASVLIAPIMILDEIEGILVIDKKDEQFNEKDKEKFDEAAKTAGFFLSMLKLYEQKSYEAKYLKFIGEHVKELHRELELETILSDAAQSFRGVMECNDVTIASIDELNNVGEVLQSTYVKEHEKFSLDEGLVGHIARHKNFIIKEDLSEGNLVVFKKGVKTKNLSFVGVPVQLDDDLLGVMWFEDSRKNKFNEDSAQALNILASQLSFAWQRAIHHEQEVEKAARDGLTDLYSHRRFQEILEEYIKKEKDLVLLFFDIDHFKRINDTHGHQAGDEVLKFLAKRIATTGIAARYGGEEFAIILPKYSLEKGLRVASRLKDYVKKTEIRFDGTRINITVSIGVAHYPGDAKTRVELIEKADRALYRAKTTGRNRIVVAKTLEEKGYQEITHSDLLP